MKTTISINLGGIAFTIDDDAYRELKQYLDALSAHFRKEEEGDEILADIEARIAEEFSRKRESGIEVISIGMVEDIISRMGRVEDLTGEAEGAKIEDPFFARSDREKEKNKGSKRLYRDPDQAILAGVSAGLGAYFNVDPVIPRIIFVCLTIFGGTGILIYIILWLILPEADTPMKQSELRGESPTIKDIEKKFKDMVETGKKKFSEIDTEKARESVKHAAEKTANIVTRSTTTLAHGIVRFVTGVAGIFITIGSFAAMLALTFLAPFMILNSPDRYIDFPISELFTTAMTYVLIGGTFFILFIPALFFFLLGLSLIRFKKSIRPGFGFWMFGIWCVALVAVGVTVATGLTDYREYRYNSPEYQNTHTTVLLSELSQETVEQLHVTDGQRITLVQGTTSSIDIEGRQRDMDDISYTVEDGTLTIGIKNKLESCFFCDFERPEIIVTLPTLSSIELDYGARMSAAAWTASTTVTMHLEMGSRAEMNLTVPEINVHTEHGSQLTLFGSATTSTFRSEHGSDIDTLSFTSDSVSAYANLGAHIIIGESITLDARADSGARISYRGTPDVEMEETSGAHIEPYTNE